MAADLGESRHKVHKVSVITITRDDSAGLRATTASVLAQQGEFEIEHIVVDGGADPQTAKLLADLGSTAQLISEPDEGRYDAMNKGDSGGDRRPAVVHAFGGRVRLAADDRVCAGLDDRCPAAVGIRLPWDDRR